ncbi:putative cell-division ATP-binding protein [Deltaproteobacteria bacterium]|nr:putative cell-division ATP-binding protein [Deltaproteobacteria bacterium]
MIRLYHIVKSYAERDALRDVSVHVEKGEMVYITGPSGAGKSTMLKLLYGAERPTSGKMLLGGVDVSKMSTQQLPALRRNMGVVFQDFKLLPHRSVAENVAMALEVIGAPDDSIRRRVPAVLNIVGLKGREDDLTGVLSGGEKQRVAIARAIVNDPAILLADEPTGNLDGAMAVEVMEILQAINLRGTTVLVATHDVGLMDRFPYRKLRFVDGRLVGGAAPKGGRG